MQLLDTQYRMHPAIAAFPSEQFYGGQLRNAEGMAEATARPWHECPVSTLACFCKDAAVLAALSMWGKGVDGRAGASTHDQCSGRGASRCKAL